MTILIDWAWRSSVILAAGLVVSVGLRQRSAALRHAVLAASIIGSLLVLPLRAVIPPVAVPWPTPRVADVPIDVRVTLADQHDLGPSATRVSQAPRLALSPVAVWAFGVGVSMALLLASLYRVRTLARRGLPPADSRWQDIAADVARSRCLTHRFELVQTSAPDMLATTGVRRHRVLLPARADRWPDSRIRIVLSHELAHIERRDWVIKIAGEIARAWLWFNPLIWLACRELAREAEHACDDIVLAGGVAARDYATDLVAVARLCRPAGRRAASTLSMANPSTLERRIAAMLNPELDRSRPSQRLLAACGGLLLTLTLAVAAVAAQQAAPSTLSGILYDQTGAVLPGVAVTLQDASQAKSTATSNAAGRVDFPNVAPGNYLLSANVPGFKSFRQDIELRDGRDWDRVITLQLGELSESISVRATRMTAPTAPQPQMPAPVRVGGNIRVPKKLVDVRPIYPESMRAAGREATVKIDAVIGKDGTVTFARVLNADIHPDFAIAAVDAVRQWKFSPTLLNGVPVDVAMVVSVAFNLGD